MLRSYVMFVAFRWGNLSLVQLLSYQSLFVVQNFTVIYIYIHIYLATIVKLLLKCWLLLSCCSAAAQLLPLATAKFLNYCTNRV